MAMKTLFVLVEQSNMQDDYTSTIVGVTDSKADAHAFTEIERFVPGYMSKEIEVVTLNVLDAKLREKLDEYLDPVRNPLCECGHRFLHHGKSGNRKMDKHTGKCRHNISYGGKKSPSYHQCKGFVLAEEQSKIEF